MAYLNTNLPPIECFVRSNFLQNRVEFEDDDIYLPCVIFGVASITHRTPLFHFIMEDGGLWWRMPIHAFCWKPDSPQEELHQLVLWDCFSSYISVTAFDFLKHKSMLYVDRSKNNRKGHYMFTLDWSAEDSNIPDVNFSEVPGQHKCGHVIKLEDGNFAIQPNNRVRLFESSFVTKWGQNIIHRKLNTHIWSVEDKDKWVLSDDDSFNYEIIEHQDISGTYDVQKRT